MPRPAAALLLAILAACAGEAEVTPPDPTPTGPRVDLVILDGGFVEVGGERLPAETAVYDLRVRVRAAQGRPAQIPWVRILAGQTATAPDQAFLNSLVQRLHVAGVLYVEFDTKR
ncbi:MAG: hypothetical protein IT458_14215 [Planctomycetes bacterium]|nr:hypothetical protein [Planctomycetota bacterium]